MNKKIGDTLKAKSAEQKAEQLRVNRIVTWLLVLLSVILVILFASIARSQVVTSPTLEGGLAIIETHLQQHAPCTDFVLKPAKFGKKLLSDSAATMSFRVREGLQSFLQVTFDTLRADSARITVLGVFLTHNKSDYNVTRRWVRAGDELSMDFKTDSIRAYLRCTAVQKTQAKFQFFRHWLPLFPFRITVEVPAPQVPVATDAPMHSVSQQVPDSIIMIEKRYKQSELKRLGAEAAKINADVAKKVQSKKPGK